MSGMSALSLDVESGRDALCGSPLWPSRLLSNGLRSGELGSGGGLGLGSGEGFGSGLQGLGQTGSGNFAHVMRMLGEEGSGQWADPFGL